MKKRRIAGTKPKNTLRLPDLDQARASVLSGLTSKESQRGYRHAIEEFIAWYCAEPRLSFNRTVVTRYRIHWNRGSWHPEPSTEGWPRFADSRTKLLIQACSALNWLPEFVA